MRNLTNRKSALSRSQNILNAYRQVKTENTTVVDLLSNLQNSMHFYPDPDQEILAGAGAEIQLEPNRDEKSRQLSSFCGVVSQSASGNDWT